MTVAVCDMTWECESRVALPPTHCTGPVIQVLSNKPFLLSLAIPCPFNLFETESFIYSQVLAIIVPPQALSSPFHSYIMQHAGRTQTH